MSPVTVTDLVQNFADACRALVPALDRAHVPWRDNEQYDNWDRVVEPLFETLVTEPCAFAAVGEPGLIRLQVVPYGFREHDPTCNAYVALDDPSPKRLVGLCSNVLPFDEVVFCECNGSAMGTLALRDARFVFVFAGFEGADQQLTIVPLDALRPHTTQPRHSRPNPVVLEADVARALGRPLCARVCHTRGRAPLR